MFLKTPSKKIKFYFMSKKSEFLKSVKLAIAGVAMTSTLAACSMLSEKHNCAGKEKNSCSGKEEKAKCSSKMEDKASCAASKMEEKSNCAAKKMEGKASCAAKKSK